MSVGWDLTGPKVDRLAYRISFDRRPPSTATALRGATTCANCDRGQYRALRPRRTPRDDRPAARVDNRPRHARGPLSVTTVGLHDGGDPRGGARLLLLPAARLARDGDSAQPARPTRGLRPQRQSDARVGGERDHGRRPGRRLYAQGAAVVGFGGRAAADRAGLASGTCAPARAPTTRTDLPLLVAISHQQPAECPGGPTGGPGTALRWR